MGREINDFIIFIRVWTVAIASACYSYSLSRIFHIPKGIRRLIFILPIIYLFIVLPSSLSSFHLGGPTIFYLVWLGNFKLLLYSFDLGPLSTHPNQSLRHFISIALLPIKVKDEPTSSNSLTKNYRDPDEPTSSNSQNEKCPPQETKNYRDPDGQIDQKCSKSMMGRSILFCVKLVAFALVVKIYEYEQYLPGFIILANYCCHLYLGVEVTLAVTAVLARAGLGLDLDRQFNEPYLATSLQDFWGRRWNLMVSNILRLSIYGPIRRVASPLVGRRWALVAATLAAFVVSGLMHEVIFYYFTRVWPTWEVTWFFVLHGVCTAVEVAVKEAVDGKFRLHRVVSGPLTIGFVAVTGVWLFLPQILRNGVHMKAISEYPIMIDFLKKNVLHLGM